MTELTQDPLASPNPFSKPHQPRMLSSREQRDELGDELESLRRDGYVILDACLSERELCLLRREFERLYSNIPSGQNSFGGFATQRLFNLVSKTRMLDALILHPKIIALVESYLEDQLQLSICSSIRVHPGETSQALHRDDAIYPIPRPHAPLLVNCMWAIDDFTPDNGATRLIPGSHRDSVDAIERAARICIGTMKAGSVLLWDGALVHGGGSNCSNQSRLGLSINYCRAWLRQQENQFLAVPAERVAELPRSLQKLLGYWVANKLLGAVENASPIHSLRQAGKLNAQRSATVPKAPRAAPCPGPLIPD